MYPISATPFSLTFRFSFFETSAVISDVHKSEFFFHISETVSRRSFLRWASGEKIFSMSVSLDNGIGKTGIGRRKSEEKGELDPRTRGQIVGIVGDEQYRIVNTAWNYFIIIK